MPRCPCPCSASAWPASATPRSIERNWFRLRRFDVPVLAPGQRPVRILHISDPHLTPGPPHG